MRSITPDELIEELQGGKWRKARGRLARSGNYRCCLGVACELIGVDDYWSELGVIPRDIVAAHAPWLTGLQRELTRMNDKTAGWDAAIALLRTVPAE